EFAGLRNATSPKPHRLGDFAEIRVLQVSEDWLNAGGLLFDINEAELAVIEHHDLDRQLLLHDSQHIAHEHGKAAVARHADNLAVRLTLLQSDRRRHPARHRAVQQAAEGPSFTARIDM